MNKSCIGEEFYKHCIFHKGIKKKKIKPRNGAAVQEEEVVEEKELQMGRVDEEVEELVS